MASTTCVSTQRPHGHHSRGCCGSVGKLMGRTVNMANPTRILAIGLCVMICFAIFSKNVSGTQATLRSASSKAKPSYPQRISVLSRMLLTQASLARICQAAFMKNRHLVAFPDTPSGDSVIENAQRFIQDLATQTQRKFAEKEGYLYKTMEGRLGSTSSPAF